MIDPASSELFSSWMSPERGIESLLLEDGPIDRSRGFGRVVPNVIAADRYLWVYAARADEHPTLAVVDLREGEYRPIAPISPGGPVPCVDPSTGEATVAAGASVDVVASGPDADRRQIGGFDRCETVPERVTAGLTRSADGARLGLGFEVDGTVHVGSLDVSTGEVESWHTRSRHYETVQFSPTDPSLLLFAREPDLGDQSPSVGDAWLARKGLGARPLAGLLPQRHHGHWWDSDGAGLWYVEPNAGVSYLDLELGRRRTVWSVSARRAHATRDGRLLAATTIDDEGMTMIVHDQSAGTSVTVARVEEPRERWRPQPQFVANDAFLAYTTRVGDRSTFALTPTAELRDHL